MTGDAWAPVRNIIEQARQLVWEDGHRLQQILRDSNKRLAPLEDPFGVDLGMHRWLRGQREERYSDWLAWILDQLGVPDLVSAVFGADVGGEPARRLVVEREYPVPRGRLDILLMSGDVRVLAVEVKLDDAESADLGSLPTYRRWLGRTPAILLARAGAKKIYEGNFELRTWEEVCMALRRMVPLLPPRIALTVRAMILAFVGAVEQNILTLPGNLGRRLERGDLSILGSRVTDYLARAVG